MRASRSTTSIAAVACAVTAAFSFGTSSAAAQDGSLGESKTRYVDMGGDARPAVEGTLVTEWGKTKAGESYSFTYRAGEAKPKDDKAAAARCSIYISDVTFRGAGANAWFNWETSQVCSGSFGTQRIETQMWRSSWSGPRGYDIWRKSKSTANSFIDYGWSVDCNDGGGTYTYYPVMKGFATGVGSSPTTRADNELRKNCGTTAP
ncbi:hypothetical protein GTY67_34305 [Streptomyces sp. SID8374]|uniref:hypothetical protein n=1 Tax=Streptomyces sp. SID8374 TaxID=2690354 RepID=UPI00136D58AF|nr:hypothetical protein [Streptomyces sp. SID8374]MYX18423.1 hypothetical protein [Streptomyces sp. SID8374]